jgi:ATP-dependent helicase/nuclease subunit B
MNQAWTSDHESVLLSRSQELELWRRIIEQSEEGQSLLQVDAAAQLASDAWNLAQSWKLPLHASLEGQEDTAAFQRWARDFSELCDRQKWIGESQLADVLEPEKDQPPVALAGFTRLAPQHAEMLDRVAPGWWGTLDVFPGTDDSAVAFKAVYPTVEAELRAAAQWALDLHRAHPSARIGIVCTDLALRRKTVQRVFLEVLHPDQYCLESPVSADARLLFAVQGGEPASSHPMIHTALLALQLATGDLPLADAGSLLRSPFLGRAMQERAQRAVLDAYLRRSHPVYLSISDIVKDAAVRAPVLASLLGHFDKIRRGLVRNARPGSWASSFSSLLRSVEWPGSETLQTAELRLVLETWNEILSEFAALDLVTSSMPLETALRTLRGIARARVVDVAERRDFPVTVVTPKESIGLPFDFLRITGCSDDAWPPGPEPNPFLPRALQRERGVPRSSAEGELEWALRVTRGWIDTPRAQTVVFTHALADGERELRGSALISTVVPGEGGEPAAPLASMQTAEFQVLEDSKGPPAATDVTHRGGARILQLQAACPFRAFAEIRLGVNALESGESGLNPRDRGKLLHETMRRVWSELQNSQRLRQMDSDALETLIRGAIRQSQWPPRDAFERELMQLEETRLFELVKAWLAVEKDRGPFSVVQQEEKRQVELGPLRFVAKVDRVDRFPDGTEAILDYKTGQVSKNPWDGPRPADPQLPIYAVSHPQPVSELLFALV